MHRSGSEVSASFRQLQEGALEGFDARLQVTQADLERLPRLLAELGTHLIVFGSKPTVLGIELLRKLDEGLVALCQLLSKSCQCRVNACRSVGRKLLMTAVARTRAPTGPPVSLFDRSHSLLKPADDLSRGAGAEGGVLLKGLPQVTPDLGRQGERRRSQFQMASQDLI